MMLLYSDDIKSILYQPVYEWRGQNLRGGLYDLILKCFKVLGVLAVINVIILAVKPWTVHELPLVIYPASLNFWTAYCFQTAYTVYSAVTWLGFDLIYAMICSYLINQLRHLGNFFRNMCYCNRIAMKEGVDRHVHLIR